MAKLRLPTRKISTEPVKVSSRGGSGRARVVSVKVNDASSQFMELVRNNDKQLPDPFNSLYGTNLGTDSSLVIEPPFPFTLLLQSAKANSTLPQCVDAYVVNIESYGYQLEYTGPVGQEASLKAVKEKRIAESFLSNPSGDNSLRQIREKSRRDLEYLGNRFLEVGRDLAGRITFIEHIPGITMRMTRKDKEPTKYEVLVKNPNGDGFIKKPWSKFFRRFVQVSSTGERVYFKEFGDPRPIDPKNGKVNADLPIEEQATEVYHQALYSPGTDYGLPRWLGALPAVLGTRESELVNLNFFRENAIPAMVLLISGGALTEESFDKITSLVNASKGREAMNRFLILEASADDTVSSTDSAPPVPRIEMKPMISERQNDGLFGEYQKGGKTTIRSSMRLPAIFTGDSEEYTKATAQAGQLLAEGQVFFPERSAFDEVINMHILPTLGITQWRFKTMGPTVYDPDALSNMIDRFSKNGALTPNILIKIANQVIDVQIPTITEKWGDIPFNYTISMINAGQMIVGFEDIFRTIEQATGGAVATLDPNQSTDPNAAVKQIIKQELHKVTTDITRIVEEAGLYRNS